MTTSAPAETSRAAYAVLWGEDVTRASSLDDMDALQALKLFFIAFAKLCKLMVVGSGPVQGIVVLATSDAIQLPGVATAPTSMAVRVSYYDMHCKSHSLSTLKYALRAFLASTHGAPRTHTYMASPSGGSRVRRPLSILTIGSLLSRTDSTVSGIPGPGRTLDRMLSAGGRRLEPALNRAADLLGYGPGAVVRRMIILLHQEHGRTEAHIQKFGTTTFRYRFPSNTDPDEVMEALVDTVCEPCRGCHMPVLSSLSEIGSECRALSVRLLEYAK